jgi:hypothetical protein
MSFETLVKNITNSFTDAWNNWDVEAMSAHLTEYAQIESPFVSKIHPEIRDNIIVGRDKILTYWTLLYQKLGHLKTTQLSFIKEDIYVTTINRINNSSILIHETFVLNEYGRIKALKYAYSDEMNVIEHVEMAIFSLK